VTLALVVAIPLGTAVVIALVGGRLGRLTLGILTTAALALSFGAGLSMIPSLRERPTLEAYVAPWLPLAGADLALVVDSAMLAVALAITGVAALVALYSIAYLEHDRGLQRYFSAFALLVAAMLVVILGSNLLLIFAGWELAGVAAYLLIAHHRDDPRAGANATRAFLVERVGDAALLAGILLFFAEFHTVDLGQLGGVAIEHGSMGGTPLIAGSLLLVGAIAKSAQLPLHVWLTESTETSAPVSALLQTTAVVGGVVLLMRLRSVVAPDVLQAAALVGGITALVGALIAVAQRDIRRILAWSTISQVGLMFVAAGLGALFAARFQLIAHALFKAVLILGAGSVRRATGDESDVARYGALARSLPWTAAAFAIGTLGLAAIPPAAGFFGVAAIASAAFSANDGLLTVLVLLTVAAAAFAGVRAFVLIFVAPATAVRDAHEWVPFDVPLVVLAVAALGFGAIVSAGVVPIGSGPADDAPLWLIVATFGIAVVAGAAAWLAYRHGPRRAAPIERATRWARGGLGIDTLYARGIGGISAATARELEVGAERAIEGSIGSVGTAARWASSVVRRADPAGPRGQQAWILAGVVALLAYWTWNGR
jgi:NADH-quinone oxidoreductase subunit L